MVNNKIAGSAGAGLSLVLNLLLSAAFIFLSIITQNYLSAAFWVSAAIEAGLVYLILILPERLKLLRFLIVAVAILLPGVMNAGFQTPQEFRPNVAVGVFLLLLVWLQFFRKETISRTS